MDSNIIQQLILKGLPDAEVQVSSDDGVHFQATVVSPAFSGKTPIQMHRMVYATLGEYMGNEIHALTLHTSAPLKEA